MKDLLYDLKKQTFYGFPEYDYFLYMLSILTNAHTIVETGLGRGDSTEIFLSSLSNLSNPEQRHLYTYEIVLGKSYGVFDKQETVDRVKSKNYPSNWHLINQDSTKATYDGSLIDILFLDADHDYHSVIQELQAFVSHLNKRAIIMSDDAYGSNEQQGPDKAFQEFFKGNYILLKGGKGLAIKQMGE